MLFVWRDAWGFRENIGLRPINRRNTNSKRCWRKWAYIWVLCMGNTGKCHFRQIFAILSTLKWFIWNIDYRWSCLARPDQHFDKICFWYHVSFLIYDFIKDVILLYFTNFTIAFLSKSTWFLRNIYEE